MVTVGPVHPSCAPTVGPPARCGRSVGRADEQAVEAGHRRDLVEVRHRLRRLDHREREQLVVGGVDHRHDHAA
ncbi:MAG: hypothetical protein ACK5PW_22490 [Burkholderiales bacterium]|jgi:hypothetical protein